MKINRLQKKFDSIESNIKDYELPVDATSLINMIKQRPKMGEAPLSTPTELREHRRDILVNNISNIFKREINRACFSDKNDILQQSALTLDYFLGVLRMIGDLDHYDSLDESPCSLLIDCCEQDILVSFNVEIKPHAQDEAIDSLLSHFALRISRQLNVYAGKCDFRVIDNLLIKSKSLQFIFVLNRLEKFTLKEKIELHRSDSLRRESNEVMLND